MKMIFVIVYTIIVATQAQRPFYAGSSPKGRPELASRFKDTSATTEVLVNNRVGDSTTEKIPVDALGDHDLVDRLNQWPREHRPFWLLNADHIEAHRHPDQQRDNVDSSTQRTGVIQQTQNSYERQNIGSEQDFHNEGNLEATVQSRPIRPSQQRSSFLGSRRN